VLGQRVEDARLGHSPEPVVLERPSPQTEVPGRQRTSGDGLDLLGTQPVPLELALHVPDLLFRAGDGVSEVDLLPARQEREAVLGATAGERPDPLQLGSGDDELPGGRAELRDRLVQVLADRREDVRGEDERRTRDGLAEHADEARSGRDRLTLSNLDRRHDSAQRRDDGLLILGPVRDDGLDRAGPHEVGELRAPHPHAEVLQRPGTEVRRSSAVRHRLRLGDLPLPGGEPAGEKSEHDQRGGEPEGGDVAHHGASPSTLSGNASNGAPQASSRSNQAS
jgi:hypothetical protein